MMDQQTQQGQSPPAERLSHILNRVLLQTAKIFQDPSRHDGKYAFQTNSQLKRTIPKAIGDFHDALDDLEIEILQAKAVMERDLRDVRAKRAERERNASAERRRLSAGGAAEQQANEPEKLTSETQPVKIEEAEKPEVDIIMTDTPMPPPVADQATDELSEALKGAGPPAAPATAPITAPAEVPAHGEPTIPESTNQDPDVQAVKPVEKPSEGMVDVPASAPEILPPLEGIPNKSPDKPMDDFNFDSMFGDLGGTDDTGGDINFNLDFSTGDLGNDSFGGDLNLSGLGGDDANTFGAAGDVGSLLPGLESYANATDDLNLLDLSQPNLQGLPGTATSGAPDQNFFNTTSGSGDLIPAESNFDDLFGSGEFNFDSGTGDGGGNGTLGEGAEFDDAFFGLDTS